MHLILIFFLNLHVGLALAAGSHPLQEALVSSPDGVELVYDDTDGMWGGVRFQLQGGTLTRTDTPRGPGQVVVTRASLPASRIAELTTLLLEIKVWEQRVAERTPVSGECKAELSVQLGRSDALLWEWYNDLQANARLARVKAWLETQVPAGAP